MNSWGHRWWSEQQCEWHLEDNADRIAVHGQACEWASDFNGDEEAVQHFLTESGKRAGMGEGIFTFDGMRSAPMTPHGLVGVVYRLHPTPCNAQCEHWKVATRKLGWHSSPDALTQAMERS